QSSSGRYSFFLKAPASQAASRPMPAPTATVPAPTPNMTRSRRVSGRLNSGCSPGFSGDDSGTSSTSGSGVGAATVLATGRFIDPDDFFRFPFLRLEDDFDRCLCSGAADVAGSSGIAAGTVP